MPEVMQRVTGRVFVRRLAELRGYRRFSIRDRPYPGIAPFPDTTTEGAVYLDIDGPSLKRLDAFQGDCYRRVQVTVEADGGGWIEAETYLAKRAVVREASGRPWDPDAFRAQHLQECLRRLGAGHGLSARATGAGTDAAGGRGR